MRRDSTSPGLSDATSDRLRWASLSDGDGEAGVGVVGIGSGSNDTSATRHWCWLRVNWSTDWSAPAYGPSLGTLSGNQACPGWLMSSQQPKYESTSAPV